MRFRQGYSGGAAPDFHRFPITETIVLFYFFTNTILASEFQKINLLNKINFPNGSLYFLKQTRTMTGR